MKKLNKVFHHRFGLVAVVVTLVVMLSFVTRVLLFVKSWPNLELSFLKVTGIFLIGLFYDIVVASFFSIPILFFCWLMKDSWFQNKWNRILIYLYFSIILLILLINVGGEIAFWDEFSVRYNFIAVDYLIYTNEVFGNIKESYNVPVIFTVICLIIFALLWLFKKSINAAQANSMRFKNRTLYFFILLLFPLSAYFLVNNKFKNISDNNYVNELAGDGIYEFGAAFWHNEINYSQFYKVNDDKQNIKLLRGLLNQKGSTFINDSMNIERKIISDSPEHKWNVVLISVESFSGDFLKHFGNKENITPFLDSLIPHSLFFENFYASGTRTVRGLEALSLAIPPTPGQSIVRRPHNEDMFTMGAVLKDKGYDVKYIYGGNSFFDNMGYFFGNSGYQVIDKRDIPEKRIHHETAWGVADEDAFDISLDECDKSYAKGKSFFNHIMTVSNHRPYTYPDGKIDIPSSSQSRSGAVKYTDYAINKFLKDASKKPWFNNSIFVIVADHCASSAGKTDLPINRYHIPCFIYAPALVKPGIESRMTSQIDLAPTVLGLMNLQYSSKFMGFDINKCAPGDERIFISTYQDMGFLKHDTLVILSPKKMVRMFKTDPNSGATIPIPLSNNLINEAIAWYQGASFLYNSGFYKSMKN